MIKKLSDLKMEKTKKTKNCSLVLVDQPTDRPRLESFDLKKQQNG